MYFAIMWPCSTFEQNLFYFCSLYDWNGFYAWLLHFSMFLWIIFLSFPGLPNNFGNCLDYQNNILDGLFFFYKLRKVNYTAEIIFQLLCPDITIRPYSSRHWEQVSGRKKVEGPFLPDYVFLWEGCFPRDFGHVLFARLYLNAHP